MALALKFATGTFATRSGAGTQDITTTDGVSGQTFQPKAYILFWVPVTSNQTVTNHAAWGYGLTDGTSQYTVQATSENADTDHYRYANESAVLHMFQGGSETALNTATHSSFLSNGFRLSYSTGTADYIVHYMAFGGTSLSAVAGNVTVSDETVTGLSFAPKSVFAMGACRASGSGGDTYGLNCVGWAGENPNDSIAQWCLMSDQGYTANSTRDAVLSTDAFATQYYGESRDWYCVMDSFDASGFSWTANGSGTGDEIYYLALSFGGASLKIGTFTVETTGTEPTDQDLPDFGFTPRGYVLASACRTNETYGSSIGCFTTFGVYDGTNQNSISKTDLKGSEVSKQRSDNAYVLQISDDLTVEVDVKAQALAITDNTPTIRLNPNNTTAYIVGYVGFTNLFEIKGQTVDKCDNPVVSSTVNVFLDDGADSAPRVATLTSGAGDGTFTVSDLETYATTYFLRGNKVLTPRIHGITNRDIEAKESWGSDPIVKVYMYSDAHKGETTIPSKNMRLRGEYDKLPRMGPLLFGRII